MRARSIPMVFSADRVRWPLLVAVLLLFLGIGVYVLRRSKAEVYSEPIDAQWLIDEVSTMHEGGNLPYHPGGWPWADKSNPHVDDNRERQFGPINLPGGHNYLITWAYLVPEEGMSNSLNAAVEITDIGFAYQSKSTGQWTRKDSPNNVSWGALASSWTSYASNSFSGTLSGQPGPGGGLVTGLGFGNWQDPAWHLHFTGEHEPIPNSSDVKEAISWVKARLVLRNPNGTDDRSQAKYVLGVGTDYKTSPGMACPCPSSAIGKHKYVTNEWRTFIASTLHPDTVRALAAANNLPPMPGIGGSPNPTPTTAPGPKAPAKYDLVPDKKIDVQDLGVLIRDYPRPAKPTVTNSPADFNANGRVDVSDLSNLVTNWGRAVE